MAISSLDLSDFLSGDKKRKDDFVQPLGSVYEEVGFVGVKNYSLADEHYFDEYAINENFILRAIHYSPITVEPKSAIRAEQHEDINLIPLLIDASADGLEILTKKNEWVPVTSLPDQIIVNVGDILQRFTNSKLRRTTHLVEYPKREVWYTSRFSIPIFLHPKSSMSLPCLEVCIDENNTEGYQDVTAWEYLNERLIEIGLKN